MDIREEAKAEGVIALSIILGKPLMISSLSVTTAWMSVSKVLSLSLSP